MNPKIKKILSKGLGEGYVGKSVRRQTDRAGFKLETSDYNGTEGKYHDEWDANQNGCGQQLVESIYCEMSTREYAGGSLGPDELNKFGLTDKDVIGKLIFFVNKLGDKTRLDEDVELIDGDWVYEYKVMKSVKEIPVCVGEEDILYKGNLVFVHFHVNSPVK
jgi:hypothetical protein